MTDDRHARDRYFRLRVAVPGYGIHHATLAFEAWYDRVRAGWRMTDYQYELRFEPAGSGRWAEHWHDDDFHRHCESAAGPHPDHYSSRPIQLFDARAELLRRYALGPNALRCAELEEG
ncbi:MAG: hypothetical protein HYY42_01145 [Chloroflexi bacterium]|nr:hypothetical protein [Chloroflexota bacterium]